MTKWNAVPVVLALGLFVAAPAQAQMNFGVQGSWGSDSDLGVGVRLETPIGARVTQDPNSILAGLKLIASGDYFFIDCGDSEFVDCSWIELNANGAVPLPMEGLAPYVGGGLNIVRFAINYDEQVCGGVQDCDVSNTEVGLNILGGLQFLLGGMSAFTEGRLELGGGEQFVVTLGVLF